MTGHESWVMARWLRVLDDGLSSVTWRLAVLFHEEGGGSAQCCNRKIWRGWRGEAAPDLVHLPLDAR